MKSHNHSRTRHIDRQVTEPVRKSGDRGRQADDKVSFEGIRELIATVDPHRDDASRDSNQLLDGVWIACQPGGTAHSGTHCKNCDRFVNWVPSQDRSTVAIRCLWNESDLVGDLMACISAVVTTKPDTPLREAAALSQRIQASYLLVENEGRFEGVLYPRDLEAGDLKPDERVRDRMHPRPAWRISPAATLGSLVELMRANDTDLVPVIERDTIVGVITRKDLINAGLGAALSDI